MSNKSENKGELSSGEMKKLIELTNRLQDLASMLGSKEGLKLEVPQIVVVGAQSEGKSSVLENIVGKDFLPRGAGIVTKRPLRLHLINSPGKEYGVFGHDNKKYENFHDIRDEIANETKRELEEIKDIVSPKEIVLRIYSPNVPDLTLIDLPGVAIVSADSAMTNIQEKIENIVIPFIEKETSLILAIIAANVDIANSVALKLATKYDPDKKRTIGVLTKLDLMDSGTDARDILDNQVIYLQRGYIGLVNRTQKDINDNKDIAMALQKEREFFENHPAYSDIKERLGTPYLRKFLCQALCKHIKNVLPDFADRFTKEIAQMKKKIELRDIKLLGKGATPQKCLVGMLKKVKDSYQTEMGMASKLTSHQINDENLNRGVMIKKEMCKNYFDAINNIGSSDERLRKKLEKLIENHWGVYQGIFTPDEVYGAVIKKEIDLLRKCSFKCIENVILMVTDLLNSSCDSLNNFPFLRNAVRTLLNSFVEECSKNVQAHFEHHLQVECSYINTAHEDLNLNEFSESTAILVGDATHSKNGVNPDSVIKAHNLVKSYMKIVKKTLRDYMPKLLTHDLFVAVMNYLESEIELDLKTFEEDDLLSLDPTEELILKELKERLKKFQEAEHEILLLSIEKSG